jgi:hypothetical protein
MRVLVGISALLVAATGSLTAQVWREPHLLNHWSGPSMWLALLSSLAMARSGGWDAARPSTFRSSLEREFPAVPPRPTCNSDSPPDRCPTGWSRFGSKPARRTGGPDMLLLLPNGDDEWASILFERIADDPPAPTLAIKRDTRIYVTVERVLNAAGQIVWEQLNSRERLWEALKSPMSQ